MRIPLLRIGGDETPCAWWEWLFAPILLPLLIVCLFVAALASIPIELVYRLRQQRAEKRLGPQLAAVGRYLEWSDVESKLTAGEGTLIVEHRSPKGPIREWWTEDNLLEAAPIALPTSIQSPPTNDQFPLIQEYAKACSVEYLDVATGTANLTNVPIPLDQRIDPRKCTVVDLGHGMMTAVRLVAGRKLSQSYPNANVVTLLAWADPPVLFQGDVEEVFLSAV